MEYIYSRNFSNFYPNYNGYTLYNHDYSSNNSNNSKCVILVLVLLIIIIICILFYLYYNDINRGLINKNTFASSRAIQDHQKSINLFKNPNSQYTDFKNAIPDMDISKFNHIKQQYKNGGLTVDDFDIS